MWDNPNVIQSNNKYDYHDQMHKNTKFQMHRSVCFDQRPEFKIGIIGVLTAIKMESHTTII